MSKNAGLENLAFCTSIGPKNNGELVMAYMHWSMYFTIEDGIICCVVANLCETGSGKEIVKWLRAMHKN